MQLHALQRVLHGQRVHDGGQHAHVIGRDPVDAVRRQPPATEDIAAADHDRDLDPAPAQIGDLGGQPAYHAGVDAVGLLAHEGLAAELQQDPFVFDRAGRLTHGAGSRQRRGHAPQPAQTAMAYAPASSSAPRAAPCPAWASTSWAKLSVFFSMPSPTS